MRNRERTRDRILKEAMDLFLGFGFSRVTMDELAFRLGMSKKTIYEHFPSKEILVRELVKGAIRDIEREVDRIVFSRRMDFVEKLKQLLSFIGMTISNFGRAFAPDLQRKAPEVWREIDEFRKEKILANFGRLFEDGVRRGIFRRDINSELLVRMYANTVQATLNPEVLSELPVSAKDIFDGIIRVFFEGILTERARTEHYRKGVIEGTKRSKRE